MRIDNMYDERNKIIRKLNKLKYKLEDKEDIKLIDAAIELMKKQKDKILELDKEVEKYYENRSDR